MNPGHLRKVVFLRLPFEIFEGTPSLVYNAPKFGLFLSYMAVLQIAMCLNLGSKKRSLQGINGWEFTTWFRDFGLYSNTKLMLGSNFNGWLGSKRVLFLTSWIQTLGSSIKRICAD